MKLAIFDIDGTLTDTNGVDDECFVQALADSHGVTGISTDWSAYPHTTDSCITLHVFQERLGRPPAPDELVRLRQCFVNLLGERRRSDASLFAEIPGASAALNRLGQESEWALAIATGSWRESAMLKLSAAGIEVGEVPVASADDGLSREEILRAAAARALARYRQSSFEKVVSVGDGLWDVCAAASLGLRFLGVGGGESEVTLRRAGATHVIEDFADFTLLARRLDEAEIPRAGS